MDQKEDVLEEIRKILWIGRSLLIVKSSSRWSWKVEVILGKPVTGHRGENPLQPGNKPSLSAYAAYLPNFVGESYSGAQFTQNILRFIATLS